MGSNERLWVKWRGSDYARCNEKVFNGSPVPSGQRDCWQFEARAFQMLMVVTGAQACLRAELTMTMCERKECRSARACPDVAVPGELIAAAPG